MRGSHHGTHTNLLHQRLLIANRTCCDASGSQPASDYGISIYLTCANCHQIHTSSHITAIAISYYRLPAVTLVTQHQGSSSQSSFSVPLVSCSTKRCKAPYAKPVGLVLAVRSRSSAIFLFLSSACCSIFSSSSSSLHLLLFFSLTSSQNSGPGKSMCSSRLDLRFVFS